MQTKIAYNAFLYQARREMGLSKRKFAKFLKIPHLHYCYYENGYVKPSKKYIQRISDALGKDCSMYFEGICSYPEEINMEDSRIQQWMYHIFSKKYIKILAVIFLFLSIGMCTYGYVQYHDTTTNARKYYCDRYLEFVDDMRNEGSITFSLLHETVRPEIHQRDEESFTSISASSNDANIRSLTAYCNFRNEKESILYIVPNDATEALYRLEVKYYDYVNMKIYSSTFSREKIEDNFILETEPILSSDMEAELPKEESDAVKKKMESHVLEVTGKFNTLIKENLSIKDYEFYSGLLTDRLNGSKDNLFMEVFSLAMAIGGVVLVGTFLFAIIFFLLFGKKKDLKAILTRGLNVDEELAMEPKPVERTFKTPKKDIRFFPFIPETVFEIAGILLVFFGSMRVIYNVASVLLMNNTVNQAAYDTVSNALFMFFTVGMFLLYFIDFDIFLEDRRCLRNFFLYGIVFFGLYVVECTLIEYLSNSRGIATIVTNYYVVPNNFGTISCYFGIMVFLFMHPKWVNTKTKMVIFRLLALLPIAWIFISSFIFRNYSSWGWDLDTWQLYFFDSERPQFSVLCVSYLVGLYLMRRFFKWRYGRENAKRFFNGNRYYFLKNLLVCGIILILSLTEFLFRNANSDIKSMGGYWQIIFLVPFLLFYHPHFGRRNKFVDYLTLGLYFVFFGIGYLVAGCIVLYYILAM
jgi:transcriptional regulator with XRE-family HTH domain